MLVREVGCVGDWAITCTERNRVAVSCSNWGDSINVWRWPISRLGLQDKPGKRVSNVEVVDCRLCRLRRWPGSTVVIEERDGIVTGRLSGKVYDGIAERRIARLTELRSALRRRQARHLAVYCRLTQNRGIADRII